MKLLKPVGIACGILLLVLLALAAYLAATFDAARVKSELAQVVKDSRHRTLRMDGDIHLSFFPDLGLTAGKLSLSEHESDATFATLDSARVSVHLMPLLSGRLEIDRIELDGVEARLIRHKDGSLNIDDLLPNPKKESATPRFDIAGVRLANARLTWQDEATNRSIVISGLDLTTDRLANAARGALNLSAKLDGPPMAATSATIKTSYDYDLDQRRYGLNDLGVELKGKIGADDAVVNLTAPKVALGGGNALGDAKLNLSLAGAARTVSVTLTLGGMAGSGQALKIDRLSVDMDAKSGDAALKGSLAGTLAADLDAQTVNLPRLAGKIELAAPQLPMKRLELPVDGSLSADLKQSKADLRIATHFDESNIRARAAVSKFSPLVLAFDLDADRLNVDRYLPPPANASKAGTKEERIDFSALKGLNLTGTVAIGDLQVKNLKLSNLKLALKAAAGRLDVAPLTAGLYGGSSNGSLSLDANGNRVAMRENLSGVHINPLLKDAIDKDVVEGQGDITLNIATHGESPAGMKRALSGSAKVVLKDGAIKGINLAQALREAQARLGGGGQDVVQQARSTEKTDFSELSASFAIAGGIAHNDDLAVKSPFLRLGGQGDIDIGNDSINYLARAAVVDTVAGQGGQELNALKGLTVPVRISGPFANLSYKIEIADLVQEAAKGRVEAGKQRLQQKLQDTVQDKLKSLFGK